VHQHLAIDLTENKEPAAQEALRLCYYMRSQGYDTYARINNNRMLNLYLANPRFNDRGKDVDACYWQQNLVTNASTPAASSGPRTTRMDALADSYVQPRSADRATGESEAVTVLRVALTQAEDVLHVELQRVVPDPE
jgi:hypothetical protein